MIHDFHLTFIDFIVSIFGITNFHSNRNDFVTLFKFSINLLIDIELSVATTDLCDFGKKPKIAMK